jgi:hypothetical protein
VSEPAPPPESVSGTLTLDDLHAAQRLHVRSSRKLAKHVLVAMLLAAIAAWLLGFHYAGWVLALGAFGGMLAGAFRHARMRRALAGAYSRHRALDAPTTYAWDAHEVHARNATGESRLAWNAFVRLREDERNFLLYPAERIFQVVPKAWFASPALLQSFSRHARAGIPRR